jgi:hypothetical protein
MPIMPEHFRFKLTCKECQGSLETDGHYSLSSSLDAYLSTHLFGLGHTKYELEIVLLSERTVQNVQKA